ncbi:hypothetical protein SSX86_031845 [Deinandra increscens subsp. villosa]|uniref:Ubiquitin-like protease family profile domain-containing protein n=1 Tax=Deinandra increscens subsp. villosa TaxID=3103831 RepID=A0AAP0C5T6_9ASTR
MGNKGEGKNLKLKLPSTEKGSNDNVLIGETAEFIAKRDAARKKIMGNIQGEGKVDSGIGADDAKIGESVRKSLRKRPLSRTREEDKANDVDEEVVIEDVETISKKRRKYEMKNSTRRKSTRKVKVTKGGKGKVEKKDEEETVKTVQDLPEGGIDISSLPKPKKQSEMFKEWKNRYPTTAFPPSTVVSWIKENNYENWMFFVLDFLLLFVTTMIEAWKNGSCKMSLLSCLDDERDVKEYDWCGYILNRIKVCKKEWIRDDKDCPFIGPLTILTLIYVDSTDCDGFNYERKGNALEFWTTSKLKEREEMELRNGGFGQGDIKQMVIDLTNYEDDRHEVKIVKEKQAKIDADLFDYFDHSNLKGQLCLLESVMGFIKKDKEYLERALRRAIAQFPNKKKVGDDESDEDEEEDGPEVEDGSEEEGCLAHEDDDGLDDDDEEETVSEHDVDDDGTCVDGSGSDDDNGDDEDDDGANVRDLEADRGEDAGVQDGCNDRGNHESAEQVVDDEDGGTAVRKDNDLDGDVVDKIVKELIPVIENKTKGIDKNVDAGFVVRDIPKMVKEAVVSIFNDDSANEDVTKTPGGTGNGQANGNDSVPSMVTPTISVVPGGVPGAFTQTAITMTDEIEQNFASVKSIVYDEAWSKISKFKLESKLKSMEGPNYSLGMSQILDATKEKESSGHKGRIKTIGKKPQRTRKASSSLCSPYIQRKVDIGKAVTKAEKKVWDYIFAGSIDTVEQKRLADADPTYKIEDHCPPRTFNDYIFGNDYLGGIKVSCFCTMKTNSWVMNEVIDAWASVLNFEEKKRDHTSPIRLIFGTLFTDLIVESTNEDKDQMNRPFFEHLEKACHGNKGLQNLFDVDIAMFPVLEAAHYYLVCFELKIPRIVIIDNWDSSNVRLKEDGVYAEKSTVCKLVQHPKWKEIEKVLPEKLTIGWSTSNNYNDCGVFMMRHMEMFNGSKGKEFNCGFPKGKQAKQRMINSLRRKYVCKILTSDANSHKGKVEWEAEDFYKMNNI